MSVYTDYRLDVFVVFNLSPPKTLHQNIVTHLECYFQIDSESGHNHYVSKSGLNNRSFALDIEMFENNPSTCYTHAVVKVQRLCTYT